MSASSCVMSCRSDDNERHQSFDVCKGRVGVSHVTHVIVCCVSPMTMENDIGHSRCARGGGWGEPCVSYVIACHVSLMMTKNNIGHSTCARGGG